MKSVVREVKCSPPPMSPAFRSSAAGVSPHLASRMPMQTGVPGVPSMGSMGSTAGDSQSSRFHWLRSQEAARAAQENQRLGAEPAAGSDAPPREVRAARPPPLRDVARRKSSVPPSKEGILVHRGIISTPTLRTIHRFCELVVGCRTLYKLSLLNMNLHLYQSS